MSRSRVWFRFSFLVFILALLSTALGGLMADAMGLRARHGAIAACVLSGLGILFLAIRSQKILTHGLKIVSSPTSGLKHSLGNAGYQIQVYLDPSPDFFFTHPLFGSKTLFLSSGLLQRSSEEELRALLSHWSSASQGSDWVVRGICQALLLMVIKKAPRGWAIALMGDGQRVSPLELSPPNALWMILVSPWIRGLQWVGATAAVPPRQVNELSFSALQSGRVEPFQNL